MDVPLSEVSNTAPPEETTPEQNIEQVLKQLIEGKKLYEFKFPAAVGDLSVVARTLERWPVYAPPIGVSKDREDAERAKFEKAELKGKQRVAEHLRRFMRKSRKFSEIVSPAFDHTNFPQDLINHIDSFLSPNLWLRGLVSEVQYANDVTRGELTVLGSLHATMVFYLKTIAEMKKQLCPEGPQTESDEAMTEHSDQGLLKSATVVVPDFSLSFKAPTILRPPVKYNPDKIEIAMPHLLKLLNMPITPYDIRQDPKEKRQQIFPPEDGPDVDMEKAEATNETIEVTDNTFDGDGNDMSDSKFE